MSLLSECKALLDKRVATFRIELQGANVDSFAMGMQAMKDDLRAILARHEPREWRGWVQCSVCGKRGGNTWGEMVRAAGHHFASDDNPKCTGTLVPYERRGGEG